jgi:hypothetical protein
MLRIAKNEHLGALFQGFQLTTVSTPAATVDVGQDDAASISRSAAGKAALTLREAGIYKRGPVVLVSPGANIADGAFGTYDTDPASGVITSEFLNSSGSGDDGSGHVILAGFQQSSTNLVKSPIQSVRATFPAPVLHGYFIQGDDTTPTILSGASQATIVRNDVGDYTLTFTPPFSRIVSAVAVGSDTAAHMVRITSLTTNAIRLLIFDDAAAAADIDVALFVLGSLSSFRSGRQRKNLQVPQLEPRIIIGKLVDDSGDPTINIGGATDGTDFTVTDNGTGDYTITFARPFKRKPIVIPCGKVTSAQLAAQPSVSAANILCFNAGGTATDDDVGFVALGYDSVLEY